MKKLVWISLRRAAAMKCPACGEAPVFEKGWKLQEKCPSCGLEIKSREPNTWFFMYMSTAAITGIFLATMFLYPPANPALARILIIAFAVPVFIGTIPLRKSLGIALDYLI